MSAKTRRITAPEGHNVLVVTLRDGWQILHEGRRVQVIGRVRRLGEDRLYEYTIRDDDGTEETVTQRCTEEVFKFLHSRA